MKHEREEIGKSIFMNFIRGSNFRNRLCGIVQKMDGKVNG